MKKQTCIILVLILSGLTFNNLYAQKSKLNARKPNIIIILADDLGWGDLGYHGSDIMTPNIDRLSKEGIILNRYYTAPICSPTRAGLMMGRYPNRVGIRQATIPPWSDFGLDTSEVILPQMLSQVGYKNRALLGKWHLGELIQYNPMRRGFTHFYGHLNGAIDYFSHKREGEVDWHNDYESSKDKGYSTDLVGAEAVRCIKSYSKQGSPFFMYVAFNAPHGPFQAKESDLKLYGYDPSKPKYTRPGAENDGETGDLIGHGNTIHQTYKAMVTCLDRNVGYILQALKDQHVDENTIVMFMSDNGSPGGKSGTNGPLKGVKFEEWEGGVRVPAIIKWPAGFKGGWTCEQLLGYVDVTPTLLDITGFKATPKRPFDGMSMLSVLNGQKKEVTRSIYLGNGAIINNQYKLIRAATSNPRIKLKEDVLYKIPSDFSEKDNVKAENSLIYQKLLKEVAPFDSIRAKREILTKGPKNGFIAPKDWYYDPNKK